MDGIEQYMEMMNITIEKRSERYSFSAVGPTSLNRMQIVSTLPALTKATTMPLFLVVPAKFPANTFGRGRRVESRSDIGVCSKAACWSRC